MNYMMRGVSTIALAAGASLAAGAYAPAAALNFSLIADSSGTNPDNALLSFARFDPALGTLTGVVFTISGQSGGTGSSVFANYSGGEGGSASASTASLFEVTSPGLLVQFNGSASSSCSTSFGSNCSSGTDSSSDNLTDTVVTVTTNLPDFTGAPLSFFDVFVELSVTANLETCLANQGSANCTADASANRDGQITVAFEFTPTTVAVPEPATLSLLGAGLLGLGAAARRRRRVA